MNTKEFKLILQILKYQQKLLIFLKKVLDVQLKLFQSTLLGKKNEIIKKKKFGNLKLLVFTYLPNVQLKNFQLVFQIQKTLIQKIRKVKNVNLLEVGLMAFLMKEPKNNMIQILIIFLHK